MAKITIDQLKTMSKEEMAALILALNAPKALSVKISEKGAVSVYGLNARFPVSLYRSQWERLIQFLPTMTKFLADNKATLDKFDERKAS
jgi:hypothetical protein